MEKQGLGPSAGERRFNKQKQTKKTQTDQTRPEKQLNQEQDQDTYTATESDCIHDLQTRIYYYNTINSARQSGEWEENI